MKRLFLVHVGDPILETIADAYRKKGHEVYLLSWTGLYPDFLTQALDNFKPDLVIINNLDLFTWHTFGKEFEDILTSGKWPLTCWYFEAPHMAGGIPLLLRWKRGPYPKNIFYLETDLGALPFYHSRGLPAGHLPLAADEDVFKLPKPHPSLHAHSLAFSGSSLISTDLCPESGPSYLAYLHAQAYLIKIRFNAGKNPALIENQLKEIFPLIHSFLLEDIWDQKAYREASALFILKVLPFLEPHFPEAASIMAHAALDVSYSFMQLSRSLDALIDKDLKIFGSTNWQNILSRYPGPTVRLPLEELSALYTNAKIVFCLTKRTFATLTHERAFHILAHGGFPLIDWKEELPMHFEKDEIASYLNIDDAKDQIDFYLRNNAAREKISKKGRERVLKDHTYNHRAQKLLELSSEHYGFKI